MCDLVQVLDCEISLSCKLVFHVHDPANDAFSETAEPPKKGEEVVGTAEPPKEEEEVVGTA